MEIAILVVLVFVMIFLITALFGAPYVPSVEKELEEVFSRLKPLTKKDVVVDFGCGDGVVLKIAAKKGAGKAIGLELNPVLALVARFRNRGNSKIKVRCGEMTKMKLPDDMTVAYVFGLDRVMKMLKPKLEKFAQEQKREIYVVSKAFEFAGMKAVKEHHGYHLYKISPAI